MKITIILTILPKIVTDKDWAGVIPIIKAENTAIASFIPNPEGVICIKMLNIPIVERKTAFSIVSSTPNR